MEDLEYVQRKLLETLIHETEKPEDKKDKTLINQLSKGIADNTKVLAEFESAPSIISKIKSLISENYSPNTEFNDEIKRIRLQRQNTKSAIDLPQTNDEENETSRIVNESERLFYLN
jgi:hypothetical protein